MQKIVNDNTGAHTHISTDSVRGRGENYSPTDD